MIRILLDECLPVKLRHRFQDCDESLFVSTVTQEKWNGIKNGKLLDKAQQSFDILITIDQSMSYQHSIQKFNIALIALKSKSNRYKDLVEFVAPAVEVIKNFKEGSFYSVSI